MADFKEKYIHGFHHFLAHHSVKTMLVSSVIILATVIWLIFLFHPLPPRTIIMACGPEGSAYEVFGKRYKALLEKQGVDLIVVPTEGCMDNLNRLNDPRSGVQAGFVMSGLSEETDTEELLSLGTIGYEPMWFFAHHTITDRGLFSLKGKRVSIGPEGSNSRVLFNQLLKRNALDIGSFKALSYLPEETEKALLSDKIDAAVIVSSLASPVVRKLVRTEGIDVANFTRADAYVALFPSLSKVTLPAGVFNLEKDDPPHDLNLLAAKTSLIVRGDMHPALQYLLMEVMSQVHSRRGLMHKAGEFPAPDSLEFPLSPEARHYYKSGKPFLQRFLPFWLAVLLEQFVVLLIPVIGLMYPLVKGLTALYGWGMQRRIFLLYGELNWLESELNKLGNKPPTPDLKERMDHLEERTNRVRVSRKYIPMLYSLKDTLYFVKDRMAQQGKK